MGKVEGWAGGVGAGGVGEVVGVEDTKCACEGKAKFAGLGKVGEGACDEGPKSLG